MKQIDKWSEEDKQNILEVVSEWVENYDVKTGEQAAQSDSIIISGYELVVTLGDYAGKGYSEEEE